MQYGPAWLFYESPLDNPFGDEQRAVDFLPFLKHPKSRVPDIATCSYGMFSSCGLLPSKKANCLVRWKLLCLSLKLYTVLVFRASCSTETMRLARRSYRAAKTRIAVRGSWSPIWVAAARASAARPCQNAGSYGGDCMLMKRRSGLGPERRPSCLALPVDASTLRT